MCKKCVLCFKQKNKTNKQKHAIYCQTTSDVFVKAYMRLQQSEYEKSCQYFSEGKTAAQGITTPQVAIKLGMRFVNGSVFFEAAKFLINVESKRQVTK